MHPDLRKLYTSTLSHRNGTVSTWLGLRDWFVPSIISYFLLCFGVGLYGSIFSGLLSTLKPMIPEIMPLSFFLSGLGVAVVCVLAFWDTMRRKNIYMRTERLQSDFVYQLLRYIPERSLRGVFLQKDADLTRSETLAMHYPFRPWRYFKPLPKTLVAFSTTGWRVDLNGANGLCTVTWSIAEGRAQCTVATTQEELGRWVEDEPRYLHAVYTGERQSLRDARDEFDHWNGDILRAISRAGIPIPTHENEGASTFAGHCKERDPDGLQHTFQIRWDAGPEPHVSTFRPRLKYAFRTLFQKLWAIFAALLCFLVVIAEPLAGVMMLCALLWTYAWVETYRFEKARNIGVQWRDPKLRTHRASVGTLKGGVLSIAGVAIDLDTPHNVSWSRFERDNTAYLTATLTQRTDADTKRVALSVAVERSSWWSNLPELESNAQEISAHDFDEVVAPSLVWYGKVHGALWTQTHTQPAQQSVAR